MPASPIVLRAPRVADQALFLKSARASRVLHAPWVSAPVTLAQYRAYLEKMAQPQNHGFLLWLRGGEELAGVINLTQVVMGPLRSGYLGYYAFAGYAGRGLMRAGLAAVATRAFAKLGLHRLEANIQPGNAASIALARACGFSREGYSPRYLKVGGRWRDHERWALLADA